MILLLGAPVALADPTSTTSTEPLSSAAPWLTQTATTAATTAATSAAATDTSAATSSATTAATTSTPADAAASTDARSSSATTTDPSPSGDLPFTGDNLLPESIAAVVLVAAGVLLRLRWRRA